MVKKKKKVISSALKKKLEVAETILKTTKLQQKKRKVQLAESKKKLAKMIQEDAGNGLENIDRSVSVKISEIAKDIRDFKELEDFIDVYIPALTAADIAVLAAQHAVDKWNVIKILKDPDYQGLVFFLLDDIEKTDGGAVKVFNNYKNNKTNPLTEFIKYTSYKMPKEIKTFQNHLSTFKDYFGLKRKKKKVPHYREPKAII